MSELEVALAGKNVSDYTRQALATALSSPVYGDVADMWRKYLEGLGLVGSVGDMFKQFYTLNNVPLWAQNPIYAGLFLTGQFTPASLFTGGEQGGWWSASDLDDTKLAWVAGRRNLLTYTDDLTNAAWSAITATVTTGILDPDGGFTAFTITATASNADVRQAVGIHGGGNTSIWIRRRTGSGDVQGYTGSLYTSWPSLSTSWQRLSIAMDTINTQYMMLKLLVSGDAIDVWHPQVEANIGPTPTAYQSILNYNTSFLAAFPNHALFQDSTGTTAVTGVEQPIGLILDKKVSPLLTTLGGTWSKSGGDGVVTVTGGVLTITGATTITTVDLSVSCTSNAYGIVTISASSVSGAVSALLYAHGGPQVLVNGAQVLRGRNGAGGAVIRFQISSGTASITIASIQEATGNHLSQATGSLKPVWSARKNLYTATEDFSNGIWASVSSKPTISTDATTAPNGLVTADKWTPAAINGTYGCYYNITRSVGAYTFSIYAKNAGYNRIGMRATDGTSYFLRGTVDLTSGTMVADGSQAGTWTITSVGNGWFKISCSATSVGSFADVSIEVLNNTLVQSAWTPDGTNGIFVWGAELEYGLAATSYQRVVTATNYNAIGFPKYFWTDGVDDNMATASVSFSTDKMSVYAGLNKLSDAAAGSVLELSATIASNNGTFQLTAPVAASATFGYASKGTVLASTSIGSLASPSKRVISAFSDIAGDSVRIDINGTDGTPVVTDQGTGNYGNYPIYAFSRSGGTLPYNGQAHELILLARASTGTEITNTEAFLTPIIG
jgi:hypothetical protein